MISTFFTFFSSTVNYVNRSVVIVLGKDLDLFSENAAGMSKVGWGHEKLSYSAKKRASVSFIKTLGGTTVRYRLLSLNGQFTAAGDDCTDLLHEAWFALIG